MQKSEQAGSQSIIVLYYCMDILLPSLLFFGLYDSVIFRQGLMHKDGLVIASFTLIILIAAVFGYILSLEKITWKSFCSTLLAKLIAIGLVFFGKETGQSFADIILLYVFFDLTALVGSVAFSILTFRLFLPRESSYRKVNPFSSTEFWITFIFGGLIAVWFFALERFGFSLYLATHSDLTGFLGLLFFALSQIPLYVSRTRFIFRYYASLWSKTYTG